VPVVHALIGLTAWAGLLGLSGVWAGYCRRHPRLAERLAPPERYSVADEAEEWLRGPRRPVDGDGYSGDP
jgi:hypothetical protein